MRILWFSNSVSGRYGYSVVTTPVVKALQKAGHEMVVFGMQSIHPPFVDENGVTHVGLRYDAFGSDILENLLRSYKIDCLVTMFDIWLKQAQYIPNLVKKLNVGLVSHVTANSYPLSPMIARFCQHANLLVTPSKFVEKTVKEAFPNRTFRISHGVDSSTYKPLPKKEIEKFKEKLRIGNKEFIALSVMRNKGQQKNYPALFHAWKMMMEEHEDLKKEGVLVCLTDPLEPEGVRLDILRKRIGLQNQIKFVNAKPTDEGIKMTYEGNPSGFIHNANYNFPAQEMVRLYNAADVHVVSSSGESFNLPTLEAMACGTPVVMPNNTTGPELVGESSAGLLADCGLQTTTPLISDIKHVDPRKLAECIEKIYLSDKLRKRFSKKGVKFAVKKDWEFITPRWVSLMNVTPYLK